MSSEESDLELQYVEVTNNVVTTTLYPEETEGHTLRMYETGNMGCIALKNELMFVDCGAIVKNARRFREDMEKRFQKPTTHLFLTHDHYHCTYGMTAFEDVTVVSSSVCQSYFRKNFKKGVSDLWKERILSAFPDDEMLKCSLIENDLFIPHTGVPNLSERAFGEKNQVIFRSCRGHSAASGYIYVPNEKVLFTGGNLNSCYAQMIVPLATVEVYRTWESLDIDFVVPGHGPIVDKSYISSIRDYFEQLLHKLRELKPEGLSAEQVVNRNDLPEYPHKGKNWTEGSPYHTQAIDWLVKYWYGRVLKETRIEDDDLMFIS
jgi:glyoxylase-like metal-dependent hydrolase (beta-lactamase superfamily II)